MFFCFKQKTAYEMRISDWSSDVCFSDLCALLCAWLFQFNLDGELAANERGDCLRQHRARVGERVGWRQQAAVLAPGGGGEQHPLQIGSASCRERVCQYV